MCVWREREKRGREREGEREREREKERERESEIDREIKIERGGMKFNKKIIPIFILHFSMKYHFFALNRGRCDSI